MNKYSKNKFLLHFVIMLLLAVFNCKIIYGQCLDIDKHKIDSVDYKNRIKFGFILNHFVAKQLDNIGKDKENFIKFYAVNFYLDSNLNICNYYILGNTTEQMKLVLKGALENSMDSIKDNQKLNQANLIDKVYYLPIIYFNEVNSDKPTLATLSEKDIGEILNFSSHGPTPFYMLSNRIILTPIYYYYSPQKFRGSNWGDKIKFVNKDK